MLDEDGTVLVPTCASPGDLLAADCTLLGLILDEDISKYQTADPA
jgi:hypothetical protein